MTAKTDYLENVLVEHALGRTAFTMPPATYVSLLSAASGEGGSSATEIVGNGYARRPVTWGPAVAGICSNSASIAFPVANPAGWGMVSHFGIHDAASSGNMLYYGTLAAPVTVNATDQIQFLVGQLSIGEL